MKDWKSFWQNYRIIEIKSKDDLLYQVGKTVKGKVISKEQFDLDVKDIINLLELNKNDIILDLCCGNGLLCYDLSEIVHQVIGVDFSEIYIENAKTHNSKDNIEYYAQDILEEDVIKNIINKQGVTKILMNDCLAYFDPTSLNIILRELSNHELIILITSILDRDRKWKFYNTLNRKINYLKDIIFFNRKSGLGYWWTKKQIKNIAIHYGFKSTFYNHHEKNHTFHYRFNVKLRHGN